MNIFLVVQLLEPVCFAERELSLTANHRPKQSAYCRLILLGAISTLLVHGLVNLST